MESVSRDIFPMADPTSHSNPRFFTPIQPLTLQEEGLRSQAPTDYPCFGMDGYVRSTAGCRMQCCIVPAKTPPR